ncbi:MAG: flagellar export protein FliJ [Sulfuricellaceae bacterium]
MAKRFPLQTLLDVAQNQSDEAGRKLQLLRVKWQEAEQKLTQLALFRDEYRGRLMQNTQHGMQMAAWREFQLFMGKLDKAIAYQTDDVTKCKQRWEAGQREWLERQRQMKAYDTLLQRHTANEAKREAKIEQNEQDEFASRGRRMGDGPSTA